MKLKVYPINMNKLSKIAIKTILKYNQEIKTKNREIYFKCKYIIILQKK